MVSRSSSAPNKLANTESWPRPEAKLTRMPVIFCAAAQAVQSRVTKALQSPFVCAPGGLRPRLAPARPIPRIGLRQENQRRNARAAELLCQSAQGSPGVGQLPAAQGLVCAEDCANGARAAAEFGNPPLAVHGNSARRVVKHRIPSSTRIPKPGKREKRRANRVPPIPDCPLIEGDCVRRVQSSAVVPAVDRRNRATRRSPSGLSLRRYARWGRTGSVPPAVAANLCVFPVN